MGKGKKDLPPLDENPIFRDLVEKLKALPQDRLEAFQEFIDSEEQDEGITKLPQAHKGQKSQKGENGNNA